MTDRSVAHATFCLERTYDASPARVFAAWAEPAAKARWFAGEATEHHLDFQVGGREVARGGPKDGPVMTFETFYREIVPDERIVYSSTMSAGDTVATVSITSVEFVPAGPDGGTRLVLTEHGAYLDGHEQPAWREQGTADQLAALGKALEGG
jgi:uncharacterized protein YndB with AHSA1/START domain